MTTNRLSSWLLLGGILTGFLGAVWQGHLAASYSKPDEFKRFHQRLGPEALFYPPYAMLENLALARWSPGKTVVVIGGNSILNGVGQPESQLWSLRLQELLGDSCVVVNLAFRGGLPAQGGALVAEALVRRGLPVVYVTNTYPLSGSGRAPGGPYGYLYWQALAQDRLIPDAARTADLARWLASLPPAERARQDEENLGARLDAGLRHQSLWHHVGYRHFFTVWNFLLAGEFWVPRGRLEDNEPYPPPLAGRFQAPLGDEMAVVRSFTENLFVPGAADPASPDPAVLRRLGDEIDAAFPPALRPRTLILLNEPAAYYVGKLAPAERARNHLAYAAAARLWRDHGFACAVAGEDFEPADYTDRNHLSSTGGDKLAELVAARIRQLPQP